MACRLLGAKPLTEAMLDKEADWRLQLFRSHLSSKNLSSLTSDSEPQSCSNSANVAKLLCFSQRPVCYSGILFYQPFTLLWTSFNLICMTHAIDVQEPIDLSQVKVYTGLTRIHNWTPTQIQKLERSPVDSVHYYGSSQVYETLWCHHNANFIPSVWYPFWSHEPLCISTTGGTWGVWHQKQVSRTWMGNYIPQWSVRHPTVTNGI